MRLAKKRVQSRGYAIDGVYLNVYEMLLLAYIREGELESGFCPLTRKPHRLRPPGLIPEGQ